MATVTKRGKGYQIRVYNGYDTAGKQIVKSKTWVPPAGWSEKRALREAQHQAALFEEQIRSGAGGNGRIRFSDFAEIWFSQYANVHLRPKTVHRYQELMKRITPALGHFPLEKIMPVHLLEFYQELSKSEPLNALYCCTADLRKILWDKELTQKDFSKISGISENTLNSAWKKKPILRTSAEKISKYLDLPFSSLFQPASPGNTISGTTVRSYHTLIGNILNDAVRWQYIPYNPAHRLEPPKKSSQQINYLDDIQTRRFIVLLRTAPDHWRRVILLLLLTGMRRGELLGLEWQDVDWENKTLTIQRSSLYLPERGVYTDTTKNASSRRCIHISSEAISVLQEQREWQIQEKLADIDWGHCNRIAVDPKGNPMHPDRLTEWFKKFIRKTDLPPITIHSLRHTYATLLIAQGVPLTAVAEQLGHADAATTATIYAHAIKTTQIAAAEKIGNLISDLL